MQKAINLENSSNDVVRVLSIADPSVIENNPTGLEYILIEDFTEPPELESHLSINYPMYDKVNQQFKWVQVQYQNTMTEELMQIENLKVENLQLKDELNLANENIDMLIELQADIIGGAV
jgi:uncharacterized protein YdcH (DUF465 family)